MPKAKYLSFFSYKNELLSSYISLSVSFFLSQNSKRVLLVDLSGNEKFAEIFEKKNDWIIKISERESITNYIQSTNESNLDVLISDFQNKIKVLEKMNSVSTNIFTSGPAYFIKEKFEDEEISEFYDFVIFNLPPDVDLMTLSGLTSSQEMILLIDFLNSPIVETFSISMGILNLVRERFNRELILSSAVPVVTKSGIFNEDVQNHLLNEFLKEKLTKRVLFAGDFSKKIFFDESGKPFNITEDFSFLL
ncbi:MAG: hypothetical protein Fur0024_1450 [Patescibacteria group bacterium]